jgi:hypothetical protein
MYIDSGGLISRVSSSLRYKKEISYTGVDGNKTFLLKPVTFKDKKTNKEYFGFIAEDVAKVEPRLVEFNDQGQPESAHYAQITALLTKTIQGQQPQIDGLKAKLDKLERK